MIEQVKERLRGRVKWFSHEKGYGFVERSDRLPDVFLHMNAFRDRDDAFWMKEGAAVEFDVEEAPKGPRAADVVLLNSS